MENVRCPSGAWLLQKYRNIVSVQQALKPMRNLLILASFVCLALAGPSDYITQPFAAAGPFELDVKMIRGVYPSTGRSYTAYAGIVSNPRLLGFEVPVQGCGHRVKTSETAQAKNCVYATNGAFFDMSTGACLGNLVVNGTVHTLRESGSAQFGMTKNEFVVGYFNASDLKSFGFTQLIEGKGLLVRHGSAAVNKSHEFTPTNSFVTLIAPRTAIGSMKDGRGFLYTVDGEEDIKLGASLHEFAEALVDFGAYHAINIDGGGSTVSTFKGQVISSPTCADTPQICERTVASITCIRESL